MAPAGPLMLAVVCRVAALCLTFCSTSLSVANTSQRQYVGAGTSNTSYSPCHITGTREYSTAAEEKGCSHKQTRKDQGKGSEEQESEGTASQGVVDRPLCGGGCGGELHCLLQVVIVKTSPATSTVTLAPVIPAGSTSSWSSEDSDGGNPATNAAKRVKVEKPPAPQPQNAEPDCLPSLTPETLDLSLTTLPLPSLILPPPLPDIGKFMDDSSSEES